VFVFSQKIADFLEKDDGDSTLQLAPCNGFQRKLIYQTIRTKCVSSSVFQFGLGVCVGYVGERWKGRMGAD
jgi:hypothetical protein